MARLRSLIAVTVLLGAIALPQNSPDVNAADEVLKVVPQDAWMFAAIRNIDEANTKLAKAAKQMKLPVPGDPLATFKMMTGVTEGLNEQGTAIVVSMGQRTPIILLPVSDYKKFIGQLKPEDASAKIANVTFARRTSLVANKGNYAVLADPNAQKQLEDFLASDVSIEQSVAALPEWTEKLDAYVVFAKPGIDRGLSEVRKGLTSARQAFANIPDETQRANLKAAEQMFGVYDRVLEIVQAEVTHFAVGLQFESDGALHIVSQTAAQKNGRLADAISGVRRGKRKPLAGLPAEPYVFAFDGPYPKEAFEPFMDMSLQMMAPGAKLSDEQQKKFSESMRGMIADLQTFGMVFGRMEAGDSLYSRSVGIFEVRDAKKYMADTETFMEQMNAALKDSGGPLKPYETSREEIAGVDAITFTTDVSAFIQVPDEAAKKMLSTMFGPGGKLTAYFGPVDATTVVFAYSEEAFKRAVELQRSGADGLATDPGIAQTARLLPADAQWVAYWSPHATIEFISTFMAATPVGQQFKLPPFPKTQPVGFAMQARETLTTDLVVPASVMEGLGTYFQTLQQLRGGPANAPQPEAF